MKIFIIKNNINIMFKIFLFIFAILFASGNAYALQKEVIDTVKMPLDETTPIMESEITVPDEKKVRKFIIWKKNAKPASGLKGGIEISPESRNEHLRAWLNNDYMTGEWSGIRNTLEKQGISLEGEQVIDAFQKTGGGKNKHGAFKSFGLLNIKLGLDTEKAGLWKGGKFVTKFQNKVGEGGISENQIGAIQLLDNFDARKLAQISEYYYEHSFHDDKFGFKIGKQDADSDFLELELATNFIGESLACYMPNIPLPAYPDPALGVFFFVNPSSWLTFKTGLYDGNGYGGSSGFDTVFKGSNFLINEAEINHELKNLPGKILIGHWLKTGDFEELSSNDEHSHYSKINGCYCELEQMIWRKNKDDLEDDRGLSLMAQFSWAPSDRSEIDKYYGTGLVYKGLFPKRDGDLAGVGLMMASLSDNLKTTDGRSGIEKIVEVFYKFKITNWFSLQPCVQYISNINGENNGAFVFGVRTVLTF